VMLPDEVRALFEGPNYGEPLKVGSLQLPF
jgi:hypothetical protein